MKLTVFFLLFFTQAHAFEIPPDFQATYELEKYGSVAATTTLRLRHQDNRIIYTSSSEAQGLVALFSSDHVTESSTLQLTENSITPLLYEYNYTRKKKEKNNQHIKITWNDNGTGKIISQYRKNSIEFTTSQPVWDKLSVQLALMNDIKSAEKNKTLSYTVIDKNSKIDFLFEYLGDEKIIINDKTYNTKKLKRTHSSGKRITTMWLATELSYIPVAIEQLKDNKSNWKMKLKIIKLDEN
ncbi:MAG: DUF3108 domain-containing protein [Gammaproteobacteria bacterium]|nr:DUF3108 domain-containing protein [Gammaproteobacteria bacterium]